MLKSNVKEPIAVVLLNLGGPEKLEDVEPFLYNLFSDRQIIRLGPWFMQKFIARRIAGKRAPVSMESYRLIGGGSPLARITAEQGAALEKSLADRGVFKVSMAMRYWQPFAVDTLESLAASGIKKIVALTLYPHYSIATTGSSLADLRKAAAASSVDFEIAAVESWPEQADYTDCLADSIRDGAEVFGGDDFQLIYSAHSLPVKFIEEGDPYLEDLEKTIRAVEGKTGVVGRLCFQSRSGPVEWLSPSTPEMLRELADQGCRNVLAVPISFVSDHVETLYELDIQYKDLAKEMGIRFERTAAPNLNEKFISALRDLTLIACCEKGWIS
ncbi:MAG: ferrochelatase [Proteobacteria bacterium]|nr:ferrochelatase [Pseudomonadota bacterium]MBU1737601.1 ferrochelatase [Pseudomonadota bacterium]